MRRKLSVPEPGGFCVVVTAGSRAADGGSRQNLESSDIARVNIMVYRLFIQFPRYGWDRRRVQGRLHLHVGTADQEMPLGLNASPHLIFRPPVLPMPMPRPWRRFRARFSEVLSLARSSHERHRTSICRSWPCRQTIETPLKEGAVRRATRCLLSMQAVASKLSMECVETPVPK